MSAGAAGGELTRVPPSIQRHGTDGGGLRSKPKNETNAGEVGIKAFHRPDSGGDTVVILIKKKRSTIARVAFVFFLFLFKFVFF